jgi:prepilin-type processing-associated H-X9-DG protein
MECSNNLTQLMKATQNWTAAKQMRLPGYTEPVGGKRLTWPVALMPYMEQQQLYDRFRSAADLTVVKGMSGTGANAQFLPGFVCAADGNKGAETGAQMSYVANTGMYVADRTTYTTRQSKANGVFQNSEANALTGMPKVTLNVADVADGASQTVAYSENVQAVTYGIPAPYDPTALADEEGLRLAAGFQWYPAPTAAQLNTVQINGDVKNPAIQTRPDMPSYPPQETARPSSYHAGGVNMGFLDGHVQFMPQTIDYNVYMQLMTPDSGASDMPNKATVVPWDQIN